MFWSFNRVPLPHRGIYFFTFLNISLLLANLEVYLAIGRFKLAIGVQVQDFQSCTLCLKKIEFNVLIYFGKKVLKRNYVFMRSVA